MAHIDQSGSSRTLHIGFRRWEQVRRLCDRRQSGPVRLRLRAAGVRAGQRLPVRLRLPDDFTAHLTATVVKVRPDPRGDTPELVIELQDLSTRLVDRLRALMAPDSVPPSPVPPESRRVVMQRVAAGTPNPELVTDWRDASFQQLLESVAGRMKVSQLLDSNQRLRAQIDGLALRMRPRSGGGDPS
jgi:hypothetical protein